MRMAGRTIRQPDSAGRIIIGRKYKDKQFAVEELPDGNILLQPVVIRHEREVWLYENPEAMAALDRGLAQSARGETVDLGSFAQYLEEED
jgi:hypothetical protein